MRLVLLTLLLACTVGGTLINGVVDVLLREFSRKVKEDVVSLPTVERRGGGALLQAGGGWLGFLSTLQRTGPASLQPSDQYTDLSIHVGLADMQFGFDWYRLSAAGATLLRGRVNGSVGFNSVYLSLRVSHPAPSQCDVQVGEVELKHLEQVQVKLTGLGLLNKWYGQVVTSIINSHLDSIKPIIASSIEKAFTKTIVKSEICYLTGNTDSSILR